MKLPVFYSASLNYSDCLFQCDIMVYPGKEKIEISFPVNSSKCEQQACKKLMLSVGKSTTLLIDNQPFVGIIRGFSFAGHLGSFSSFCFSLLPQDSLKEYIQSKPATKLLNPN